jgi:hypothetical protein
LAVHELLEEQYCELEHDEEQHTLFSQKPELHWVPLEQLEPFGRPFVVVVVDAVVVVVEGAAGAQRSFTLPG